MKKRSIFSMLLFLNFIFSLVACGESGTKNPSSTSSVGTTNTEWVVVTEATCTEEGLKEKVVNGETIQESIPALGHKYGEWVVTLDASCEEKGSKYHNCERCGNTETVEIEANGHSLNDDKEYDLESHSFYCAECDTYFENSSHNLYFAKTEQLVISDWFYYFENYFTKSYGLIAEDDDALRECYFPYYYYTIGYDFNNTYSATYRKYGNVDYYLCNECNIEIKHYSVISNYDDESNQYYNYEYSYDENYNLISIKKVYNQYEILFEYNDVVLFEYNDVGKIKTVTYCSSTSTLEKVDLSYNDNKVTLIRSSFDSSLDSYKQVLEVDYILNDNKQPVESQIKYSEFLYSYSDGRYVKFKGEYLTYNENMTIASYYNIVDTYYDKEGTNMLESGLIWHELTCDQVGQCIKLLNIDVCYLPSNASININELGAIWHERKYDEYGKLIEDNYFSPSYDYYSTTYSYTTNGNTLICDITECYKLASSSNEVTKYKTYIYEFDDNGNLIKREFVTESEYDIDIITYTYNDYGQLLTRTKTSHTSIKNINILYIDGVTYK